MNDIYAAFRSAGWNVELSSKTKKVRCLVCSDLIETTKGNSRPGVCSSDNCQTLWACKVRPKKKEREIQRLRSSMSAKAWPVVHGMRHLPTYESLGKVANVLFDNRMVRLFHVSEDAWSCELHSSDGAWAGSVEGHSHSFSDYDVMWFEPFHLRWERWLSLANLDYRSALSDLLYFWLCIDRRVI